MERESSLKSNYTFLLEMKKLIKMFRNKEIDLEGLHAEVKFSLEMQEDTLFSEVYDSLAKFAGQLALFDTVYGYENYSVHMTYLEIHIEFVLNKIRRLKKEIQNQEQEILHKKNLWKTIEPDFHNVQRQLELLIAGQSSREQISDWAVKWVLVDNYPEKKEHVWKILKKIAGASLKKSPTEYVYSEENFREWIKELEQSV
ncbi:hypothetical protein A3F06_03950 [candidate division TM6 bacterium RIFCSPHIGHO2_12_FULL_36_22]|nr:MAG: hypothetical protein A3F06_03950 [candidate division TM6 bacterium RIFCSPHIGHO2_12_FULL_36_22]